MIFWNSSSYEPLVIPFFLSTWWRTTPSCTMKPHKTETRGKDCTNCFKWRCTGCLQFFAIVSSEPSIGTSNTSLFSHFLTIPLLFKMFPKDIYIYLIVIIKQCVAHFSFWERFWLHVYKSDQTNIFLLCHYILNIQHQYFQQRASHHIYLVMSEFFPTWLGRLIDRLRESFLLNTYGIYSWSRWNFFSIWMYLLSAVRISQEEIIPKTS